MSDTVTITVKLFATLQLKLGVRELRYEGPVVSMKELIAWIEGWAADHDRPVEVAAELLEPDGTIRPGTMLLIDGRNVHHLEGVDTRIDGAVVSIFPPAGGG